MLPQIKPLTLRNQSARAVFDIGECAEAIRNFSPKARHIDFSADGRTAWFDEMLVSAGSGVVSPYNSLQYMAPEQLDETTVVYLLK